MIKLKLHVYSFSILYSEVSLITHYYCKMADNDDNDHFTANWEDEAGRKSGDYWLSEFTIPMSALDESDASSLSLESLDLIDSSEYDSDVVVPESIAREESQDVISNVENKEDDRDKKVSRVNQKRRIIHGSSDEDSHINQPSKRSRYQINESDDDESSDVSTY